ncbi:MAG: hypothetical protein KatS3mg103_0261 [Phycisphaerales bacterium]|nr:MAG: hypothetical protein KatS3mg103_0261 [Phycisphaerales bacterium]
MPDCHFVHRMPVPGRTRRAGLRASACRAFGWVFVLAVLAGAFVPAPAMGQLRVATWNLTIFNGEDEDRNDAVRTALFETYNGRHLRPDVLVVQEVTGSSAAVRLPAILNADPRGGQDWALAPFVDGPTTDSALLYRTSRVSVRAVVVASEGGSDPLPPRHTMRYDLAVVGYDSPALSIYSTHMKAGTGSRDRDRRLAEAQAIRADAQALPQGTCIMLAGDFNMQSASEEAYQALTASRPDNNGRLFDPIASEGSWNDSALYRFVHTQDPRHRDGRSVRPHPHQRRPVRRRGSGLPGPGRHALQPDHLRRSQPPPTAPGATTAAPSMRPCACRATRWSARSSPRPCAMPPAGRWATCRCSWTCWCPPGWARWLR